VFINNGMKSKPFRKKRRQVIPVMTLIPQIKHILFLLLRNDSNPYKIYQDLYQTGFTDKTRVLNALEHMRKADLVTRQKIPRYSVKTKVSLSELGRHLGQLMLNVENYLKCRSKLENSVPSKFTTSHLNSKKIAEIKDHYWGYGSNPLDDRILKHPDPVLKRKGWSDNEIFRFTYDGLRPTNGILSLINSSPDLVISILPDKYRILLELTPNSIAKSIIQKIIIDLITDVLQHVYVKPYLYLKPYFYGTNEIDKITDKITKAAIDYTDAVTRTGAFRYKFVREEVNDLLESIFFLTGPSKVTINDKIRFMTEYEDDKMGKDALPYLVEKMSDLIPFYNKLCKIEN
jgi:hypothetical protein